jgi:predicted dehydrogenase
MTNSFKVAIVGAGYMATEHAKAFSDINGVSIVGFCSKTESKALALAEQYGAKSFCSVSEMYEATQADIVISTVPEMASKEIACECMQFPWLCLFEKPVGKSLEEAEGILSVRDRLAATVFVALNRRSHSSTLSLLSGLEGDDSSRVINVYDQQDKQLAADIGHPSEVVDNWMYANSIHLVDYFSLLARGALESIEHISKYDSDNPGTVLACLKYSSGDLGIYQAVWNGPGPWSVVVSTANHRYEMKPLEKLTIQKRGERTVADVEIDSADIDYKPGLYFQATELIRFLESGNTSLATLEEATRSMRLVSDIYQK